MRGRRKFANVPKGSLKSTKRTSDIRPKAISSGWVSGLLADSVTTEHFAADMFTGLLWERAVPSLQVDVGENRSHTGTGK